MTKGEPRDMQDNKQEKADGRGWLRRLKAPILLAALCLMLAGATTTAFAGASTAPGCDDGLWRAMQNRAEAQRMRDAAYARIARQPTSALATTCFDLALSMSARLGGIFSDVAGGFVSVRLDLKIPPLTAWGNIFANAAAMIKIGRASPEFFPNTSSGKDFIPPPAGGMQDAVGRIIGTAKAAVSADGKMNLHSAFAGMASAGAAVSDSFGNHPDGKTLLDIYWKTFHFDLNDYLPNFGFSIGSQMGFKTALALNLMLKLNLQLPTIPHLNFSLGCPLTLPGSVPGGGALQAAAGALCGLNFSASLGGQFCGLFAGLTIDLDLGPLMPIFSFVNLLAKINAAIDAINGFIGFIQSAIDSLHASLDLYGAASILGSVDASMAGIDWPSFDISLPGVVLPGCLVSTAIWAAKNYDKASGTWKQVKETVNGAAYDVQGAIGGGPFGKLYDAAGNAISNASMSDMPFFTYADMVTDTIAGAGAELVGSASAAVSGGSADQAAGINISASVDGEFATAANVNIKAQAKLDLSSVLAAPGLAAPAGAVAITSWKAPPPVSATMSTCAMIGLMPGPAGPGTCQ